MHDFIFLLNSLSSPPPFHSFSHKKKEKNLSYVFFPFLNFSSLTISTIFNSTLLFNLTLSLSSSLVLFPARILSFNFLSLRMKRFDYLFSIFSCIIFLNEIICLSFSLPFTLSPSFCHSHHFLIAPKTLFNFILKVFKELF